MFSAKAPPKGLSRICELPPEILCNILNHLPGIDIITIRSFGNANCWNVKVALQLCEVRPLEIFDGKSEYLANKTPCPEGCYGGIIYTQPSVFRSNNYYTSLNVIEKNLPFMNTLALKQINLHFKLEINDSGERMAHLLSNLVKLNIPNLELNLSLLKIVGDKKSTYFDANALNTMTQVSWSSIKSITNKATREYFNIDEAGYLCFPLFWLRNSFNLKELYLGEKLFLGGELGRLCFPNLKILGFECIHLMDKNGFKQFLDCHSKGIENLTLRNNYIPHNFRLDKFEILKEITFSGYTHDITSFEKRFYLANLSVITVQGKYPNFPKRMITEPDLIHQPLNLRVNSQYRMLFLSELQETVPGLAITLVPANVHDTIGPAKEPYVEELQRQVQRTTMLATIFQFCYVSTFLFFSLSAVPLT